MRSATLRPFIPALALLTVVTLSACPASRKFIFPAPTPAKVEVPAGAELLEIPMANGTTAFVLHAPAPDPTAPVIVYFHGNGGQLSNCTGLLGHLVARGFGFFAVEYPGYGPAAGEGEPTEAAIYETAEAALAYLRDTLAVGPERVILHGWSLGTGVATEMAARGHGSKMVLFAPYTSMPDMAELKAGKAVRGLIIDPFDNLAKAPALDLPVLIVHGDADNLIPVDMGRRLADAFPRASLLEVSGAGHNPLQGRGNLGRVLDRIEAFGGAAPSRPRAAEPVGEPALF